MALARWTRGGGLGYPFVITSGSFRHAGRQVAAQGHQMTDTGGPVVLQDSPDGVPGRADTGKVGGGDPPFVGDFLDHGSGALPGGAAGPVGDGEKGGLGRRQLLAHGP